MSKRDKAFLILLVIVLDFLLSKLTIGLIFKSVEMTQLNQAMVTASVTILYSIILTILTILYLRNQTRTAISTQPSPLPTNVDEKPPFSGLVDYHDGLPLTTKIWYKNASSKPIITKAGRACLVDFGNGIVQISARGGISISRAGNFSCNVITKSGFIKMG